MNKLMNVVTIPLVCASLAACVSSSKNGAKPAPAGYTANKGNGSFKLQPFKEVVLDNGLKIIYVRDESLPRVSFTMLVKTGNMQEPQAEAGLNALTAYLLEQGTQKRDAMKIADEFGQMGSSLDISPGYDVTTVYTDSLTSSADKMLDLFADVVMNPAFKDVEITRMRSQVLASLKKKIDNPSAYTDEQMDLFLFGEHPYGRDVNGTVDGVRAITKQEIIKHYLTYYRPNNTTMAIVGKFDDTFEKQVQEVFSKWTKRTIPVVAATTPPPMEGLKVRLIVKSGLKQTQIRVSQLGIERKDEDFIQLRLANEALGGSFGSRLNQKVRDDLGLTYSIYSNFDVRKERGSFDISTFTKNETAGKTLDETLKVVADYDASGATDAEVTAARNQLVGQFPRAIETADRLAYNLLVLDFYGIKYDYLTDYIKNVNKIKGKDVNAAFKRHIDPKNFKVVVYGDASIVPQFEKYKPEVVRLK